MQFCCCVLFNLLFTVGSSWRGGVAEFYINNYHLCKFTQLFGIYDCTYSFKFGVEITLDISD